MTIVGMGYDKINAEKTNTAQGALEVSHKFAIQNVEKLELKGTDAEVLKFSFELAITYRPNNVGHITLGGHLLWKSNADESKAVLEQWSKEKKVEKGLKEKIFGHIAAKANLEAAIISREIALPPPFPLPKLIMQE